MNRLGDGVLGVRPLIRAIERILFPSTKAPITLARSVAPMRFILTIMLERFSNVNTGNANILFDMPIIMLA